MGRVARRAAGLAAALVLLGAAGARAADAGFTLHYDVRFGPLRLLSMRTTIALDGTAYRATTHLQTEGLVAVLFPWTAESVTEGTREPLRPRRHVSDGRFRDQRRLVEIAYGDDGEVRTRVDPPAEDDWRHAVPAEAQRATLDPLTASMAAIERQCQGRVPVFDGRRRYDLRLEDLGSADLAASSRRMYAGPTHRCRAVVEALGGFWQTDPRDSETPTTLDFWIAPPRPDVPPSPVYLELAGARGTLQIDLTEADPAG